MLINRRIILIALGALIILGIGVFIYFGHLNYLSISPNSYQTPNGIVTIPISLPETPTNITKYLIIPQENDTIHYTVYNLAQTKTGVTSETDAPIVVQKIMEQYGGLPSDAIYAGAETSYLNEYESSKIPFLPDTLVTQRPVSTDVGYGRRLDNISVTGNGGFIKISLGKNDELLYLKKVWRTVKPAGTEKIIPVSQAIEKLVRGEILNQRKCFCDLNVDRIYLAYWENGEGEPQDYLDPVWVFSGTTSSGEVINYKVYARDEGSSLMTPVAGVAGMSSNATPEPQSQNGVSTDNESVNTTVNRGTSLENEA
jgi:hypothetical protein